MDIDKNIDFENVLLIIDKNFNDFLFRSSGQFDIESFLKIQKLRESIKNEIFMEVYKNNGMY